MGEEGWLFRTDFNRSLHVEARAERLTSEGGGVLTREVIERVGITRWLVERLEDRRNPDLITHPLDEMTNTRLLLLAQGWRDQDNADELRHDAALRLAASSRKGTSPLKRRAPRP